VTHQHILDVLPLQDGLHRAEDFVLGNGHAVIDIAEHCGSDVVPLVPCSPIPSEAVPQSFMHTASLTHKAKHTKQALQGLAYSVCSGCRVPADELVLLTDVHRISVSIICP